MADVSRAGLPSSSSKHVYDGVFGSNKVKSSSLSSFNDDDYGDIFGCSKLDNGGWQSSCCSIPVVELPVSEQRVRGVRGIQMDYGGILGGFSDEGLSLMNGNELFDQLKKKARTSPPLVSVPRARSKEQTKEVTESDIPSHSQNVQPSVDGISKSSDGVKCYKQKTNDIPSDETNGIRHVGHFRSTSGPTSTSLEDAPLQEVQNSQTSVVKADTQFDNDMPIRETHSRNSSSDLRVNEWETEHDTGFQKAPVLRELDSAATSNNTLQFTDQLNGASHDVDSSHKAPISETPVIQADTDFEVDINLATEGNHGRHSNPDIGVNELESELDTSFKKAHVLSGSNSAATSCTSQPCSVADEADVKFDAENNFGVDGFSNSGSTEQKSEAHSTSYQESCMSSLSSAAFDSGKKLRRHSRMTSLDLGRQAYEHDAGGSHRKSRLSSSYSFDASHDPSSTHLKVQPSKVIPSSSQPHFFPMESRYKISENSKSSTPLPSLDDQLDMNSLAAISASALERAIEEADMQIRLAKEFLEREGQGCIKLRFKDTLKAQVMKENKHANKIYNVIKKNMVEDCSQVDDVTTTSPFGRNRVLESAARFVPVDEGHKQFLKESIKGEIAEVPESIEEGAKNEAGEWEATKHLNQLITGVKNRLASFMTWQAETEKKEESKEVESVIKQPHSSDDGCEPKETVENEFVIISANKKEIEENVTGVVPSHIDREESGCTRINAAGHEKVGGMVDSTLDTEGSIRTNFLFFTFSSERLQGLPHPKQTEKKESQGSAEIEIENRKKLVDTVMNGQIQRKGNEENVEVQDNSVSQDYGERLINSIYEECIATIKDHYPMAAHDTNEFTHEEDNDRELSQEANVLGKEEYADDCAVDEGHQNDHVICEEHGVDGIESTNEKETSDRRVLEESEDDRSASIPEAVNDTKVNEECGIDTYASIHEADDDTRVNEECGDDTYVSSHEADNDTRVNEEYTSIHDEGRSAGEAENRKLTEEHGDEPMDNVRLPEDIVHIVEDDNDKDEIEVFEESEDQPDNPQLLEKIARASKERSKSPVNEWDQCTIYHIEEVSGQMNEVEEDHDYQSQADHVEDTKNEVEQASCMEVVDKCWKMEDAVLSKAEEAACRIDGSDVGAETEFVVENEKITEKNDSSNVKMGVEIPAPFDKETEEKMKITNHSSVPEITTDHPVLSHTAIDCLEEKRGLAPVFAENAMDFDGFERHNGVDAECENSELSECETDVNYGPKDVADGKETDNAVELDEIEHHDNIIDSTFPCEDSVPHECVTDVNSGQNDVIDGKETELKSDNFANQTIHFHESEKTLDIGDAASVSDQEAEKCNVEVVHRRRRWFENREAAGAVERPVVCEGSVTNLVVDQDVLEESDIVGSVEIHADKVDSETAEVNIRQADTVLNHGDGHINVETTHKRRRWFVKRGEEGLPQPPSLFAGINVTSELDHEVVNGSMPHCKSDVCLTKSNSEADEVVSGEKDKQNVEATPRRKRWFESVENVEPAKNLRSNEDDRTNGEVNQEHEEGSGTGKHQNLNDIPTVEEMNDVPNRVEPVNESHRDMDAENRRKKEKERLAVERAIREVRERAFAEAKERARRDATERPNRVTSQKSGPVEGNSASDKASIEMKIRAERAAVERATAEVRERALQKALSEKASQRSREQSGRHPLERSSSLDPKCSSSSHSRSSDPSNNGDKYDEADGESAQRRKARMERQNRTMERAAKALEEKNKRDLLVQKEQAARNMLADALDAEVKRWSTGKEGNVRALLSTLQYILGSDSGWQAVSLTDLVAPTAVRKAYKKATLCVHPDKLQQRGATIQQKYICEKVFDLLKDAWSRFNPDER